MDSLGLSRLDFWQIMRKIYFFDKKVAKKIGSFGKSVYLCSRFREINNISGV
jgi:hypothetical protein